MFSFYPCQQILKQVWIEPCFDRLEAVMATLADKVASLVTESAAQNKAQVAALKGGGQAGWVQQDREY